MSNTEPGPPTAVPEREAPETISAARLGLASQHTPPPSSHVADAERALSAPSSKRPLQIPAFRNLWLNSLTFFLVMNAHRFVVGWYVLDDDMGGLALTAREQGIAVFATGLPSLFLVLQAGAWSDRHDRRLILVASQIGSMLPLAVMATLTGFDSLAFWLVVVLSLITGVFTALGQPVRSALLPALVSKEQLTGAIAFNALAITASLILGPVAAQVLGTSFGFTATFAVMAALLTFGIWPALRIEVPPRESVPAKRALFVEIKEAVGFVRQDPALRALFGLLALSSTTVNVAIMVLLQARIEDELDRSAGDAGLPLALIGLGIALTSVFVIRKGDMQRKGAIFMRALMLGSTMTFLMGRATDYWQLLPLALAMGLAGGFYINMNQSLIQGNTPDALMGRVMGLFMLIQAGLTPFGALAFGAIATEVGIGNVMSACAAVMFLAAVTTYLTQPELRELG